MNLNLTANPSLNQPTGFGNPSFGQPSNGFNSGFGGQQQFGQQIGFGTSTTTGFGLPPNAGFGSQPQPGFGTNFGVQGGQQQGQPKKLITFDSKPTTNDEFSTFQEAKPKNPVFFCEQALKNYTSAEADLIDLSELTSDAVKKGKKGESHSINLGAW